MSQETNLTKFFQQREMIMVLLNPHLGDINQYFIHSETTNNEIYSDLQFNINHAFLIASRSGSLQKVKYFLTSPELNIHADINFNNNAAIEDACCRGYEHLVNYYLFSNELKENAKLPEGEDMDSIIEEIIINMTEAKTIDEQIDFVDFLNYLLKDCKMRPSETIVNLFKTKLHPSFYEPAIEHLKKNELYHLLQNDLNTNLTIAKKIKL